jgi:DUF971 family protein
MIEPVQIVDEADGKISIRWSDDTRSEFTAAELRRSCPCAGCVNEWTGEKILHDDNVVEDLKFDHISVVGRYALNFHFSDGHETGIFSFAFLNQLAGNRLK